MTSGRDGKLSRCHSLWDRIFDRCADDPKTSVHRCWGISLIFVILYCIFSVVEGVCFVLCHVCLWISMDSLFLTTKCFNNKNSGQYQTVRGRVDGPLANCHLDGDFAFDDWCYWNIYTQTIRHLFCNWLLAGHSLDCCQPKFDPL